ncbi:MAG: ArsA family ATPase [Solirubrobacterales bacterium]|nr:ArsA family ATPase [Solirubrobacterales bacterium]
MIPRDLYAKRLLVVTGKGGVGKTTVAAALGKVAASRGLRTIVAEVAARDDAAHSLGARTRTDPSRPAVVFEETCVSERLHHISIDPQRAMEEYLVDQLPVRALADALVASRLFQYLAAATPGMRELLTVGKVWELAQAQRRTPGAQPYDLVILDAPATGHGLALLRAPRTFADTARVGPIARQGRTIDRMLSDPTSTGVLAVTTPEETPVSETLVLRAALREQTGLELDAVIVNQMMPERLNATETLAVGTALTTAGAAGSVCVPHRRTALHAAQAQQTRFHAQRAQLQRLRRGLDGEVPVTTLPTLVAGTLGDAQLAVLARKLTIR